MNFLSKATLGLINSAIKRKKESQEISEKVISGKIKRSEVAILARGGVGVSRATKRKNRNAYRKLLKREE